MAQAPEFIRGYLHNVPFRHYRALTLDRRAYDGAMNRPGAARRRPSRLLRRLRFRAWHAARHHYMAGFTAIVLLVAGAASLGAFSKPDEELLLDRRVIAVAPRPPAAPGVPINAPRTPRLVMTYYIVDSQAMVDSFNMMKAELRHKEWLEKSAYEVLLVRNPDEQVQAQKAIDDARERCVCAEFRVEDLRR